MAAAGETALIRDSPMRHIPTPAVLYLSTSAAEDIPEREQMECVA